MVVIAAKISKIEFLAPGCFGQDKFAGAKKVSRYLLLLIVAQGIRSARAVVGPKELSTCGYYTSTYSLSLTASRSHQSKLSVVLPTPIVTVMAMGYVKPPCLKLVTFVAKEGGGPRTQQYRSQIVLYSRSDPGLCCIEPVAKMIFSTKLLCSST